MTIAGFKLGKKHFIIIGVLILVVVIVSTISGNKEDEELEKRRQEALQKQQMLQQQQQSNTNPAQGLSRAEVEQQSFIKQWGQPPQGFRWDRRGNLVATSSDELNNEEVLWSYLRALSLLDFSTVQKYSSNSQVYSVYSSYFSDSDVGNASYYDQFLRKVYKLALTSLEVESVSNAAVFADGTSIITVKCKVLDLTNKDIWLEDKQEIFDKLAYLYRDEDDTTKAEQYIYDYIYEAYEEGKAGKREQTFEIKLDKVSLGGWLVSDDTDLSTAFSYRDGVDLVTHIIQSYNDYAKEAFKNSSK